MDYKEKLKSIVNSDNTPIVDIDTFLKYFPELKESSDERTRQEMLAMFSNADDYGLEKEFVKRAIAYLEKQDKQILANPVKTCKDKQKPADKVWPKFNVKDWVVVDDGRIGRIIKCYKYFADVDLEFSRLSTNVNNIRLWAIQDAKDGDVLVTGNKNIFIFKSISDCTVYDYCGLYFGNFIEYPSTVNGSTAVQLPIGYTPATKEQRDLLFQKMKEAGYEWDAKKKELKKIEQIPTNNQFTTEQADVLNKRIDKFLEQKLTWSEEDEKTIVKMRDFFIRVLGDKPDFTEDKRYEEFIEFIDNRLKSLKLRNNWKPNDEQNTYKNGVYQEANGVRIWHNGHTFLVPKDWNKGEWPLLNKKVKKNSKQKNKRIMSEVDALLDWDFVAATKHIQNLGTDIPLKDGEYLITAPVWLAMYENRIELNKALNNIGAVEIDFNKSFWLAQQSSIKRTWYFFGYNGSLANSYVTFAYQIGVITL